MTHLLMCNIPSTAAWYLQFKAFWLLSLFFPYSNTKTLSPEHSFRKHLYGKQVTLHRRSSNPFSAGWCNPVLCKLQNYVNLKIFLQCFWQNPLDNSDSIS